MLLIIQTLDQKFLPYGKILMASNQIGVVVVGAWNFIEFFLRAGFFEKATGHGDRDGLVKLSVDKQYGRLDILDQRQTVIFYA